VYFRTLLFLRFFPWICRLRQPVSCCVRPRCTSSSRWSVYGSSSSLKQQTSFQRGTCRGCSRWGLMSPKGKRPTSAGLLFALSVVFYAWKDLHMVWRAGRTALRHLIWCGSSAIYNIAHLREEKAWICFSFAYLLFSSDSLDNGRRLNVTA
jgi:hypothetical protein